MLYKRHCRIWSLFPLALVISIFNTAVIVMFLAPHHIHEKTHEQHGHSLPLVKDKQLPAQLSSSNQDIASQNYNSSSLQGKSEQRPKQPTATQVNSSQLSPAKKKISDIQVETYWFGNFSGPTVEEEFQGHSYMHNKLKFYGKGMLMAGKLPKNPVELVIGIPTVKRTSKDYLSSTLTQLVQYLSHNDTKECHIVVFSADMDISQNQKLTEHLKTKFKDEIESGLIEVVKPDSAFYPKFTKLPMLWKDKMDRIKWRSKQCVDYALLFAYCRSLGKYYLQLEDDVLVAQEYFSEIKQFIQARDSSKWSNLQFGTQGFIGMLFRTDNLGRLALFVKMYFWLYPVDILFRHFNDIHLYGNSPRDVYKPPLFRHLGAESSLKGQKRKIAPEVQGKYMADGRVYKDANNPPGSITTNIEVFGNYNIHGPYRSKMLGYFWGKTIKLSDFVLITFTKELTLLRVVVDTGAMFAPEDVLGEGRLETTGTSLDGQCDVKNYSLLKSTRIKGKIEASPDKQNVIPRVKCLRLIITKLNYHIKTRQPRWLVIREIAVWSQ